jgi:AbrB family looped-hinge helix DNA binding protein
MDAVSATITSKGQVTIPKRIRQLLRLKPGDTVRFRPARKNLVHLEVAGLQGGLEGCLRDRPRAAVRPATPEDIAAAVAAGCGGNR